MDVVAPFVDYIVNTRYEDLHSEVVAATKQHLMHTLATVIGGSAAPGCKAVVELVTEWGEKEESTILVYGSKIPAVHAALANSTMGHALDFCLNDDRTDHALSPVLGCFASAAAASKILRLSSEQILDALSIANCQVWANGISITSPSLTKRLTPGFAVRTGIFSTLLAQKGFTGSRNILQGRG